MKKTIKITNFFIFQLMAFNLYGQASVSDHINLIKKKMTSENYTLQIEKKYDLNKDGVIDEILLFNKNIKYSNENDIETLDSPIYIILSPNKIFQNNKIIYTFIPNNSNLDNTIVVKDNYFTIEQTTGNGSNKKTTYTTFKFIENKFFLHKYGYEFSFPQNNKLIKNTKIYTQKNFGNIAFENFDAENLKFK